MLLVGMKGLGAEVAKNLILAGVKGLTMLDHQQVRSLQLWLAKLLNCPWCSTVSMLEDPLASFGDKYSAWGEIIPFQGM